jgi:hypothetical protein
MPRVGHTVFARIADGGDLAFDAAATEATRHQDGVHRVEQRTAAVTGTLDRFGVDVVDVDARTRLDAGVDQRFGQRLVRLGQVDILADEGHIDLALGILERVDHALPGAQIGARARMFSLWQTISSSIWSCSMAGIL